MKSECSIVLFGDLEDDVSRGDGVRWDLGQGDGSGGAVSLVVPSCRSLSRQGRRRLV